MIALLYGSFHGQPVSAAFIRPWSGSGPEPRRDLLDQPRVAIGIGEARERPVAGALGMGARLPRLDRERRAVPDVTHLDATADELVIGGLDVGDDQLPLGRAWRGRRESLAERDRGRRARGCELDDAKALHPTKSCRKLYVRYLYQHGPMSQCRLKRGHGAEIFARRSRNMGAG